MRILIFERENIFDCLMKKIWTLFGAMRKSGIGIGKFLIVAGVGITTTTPLSLYQRFLFVSDSTSLLSGYSGRYHQYMRYS